MQILVMLCHTIGATRCSHWKGSCQLVELKLSHVCVTHWVPSDEIYVYELIMHIL
jgi:hypothetical protein